MDFSFSRDQLLFQDNVRSFLINEVTPERIRELWLSDGTAWRKWCALVEAQGGRAADTERILEIHRAPIVRPFEAERSGILEAMDAEEIGRACVALGAGRARATDHVDFAVGCGAIKKVGSKVTAGEPMLTIHARDEQTLQAALAHVGRAVRIG